MKALLLALALFPTLASASLPKETNPLSVIMYLVNNDAYYVGINQGYAEYAATFTCNAPVGTGNPNDQAACFAHKIGAQANELLANKELVAFLRARISRKEFYAGLNQGWIAYTATVRCYNPVGNPNGAYSCTYETVK